MLPYGNGCKVYPDCFTCPAPDCVAVYGSNKKRQEALVEIWQPVIGKRVNTTYLNKRDK